MFFQKASDKIIDREKNMKTLLSIFSSAVVAILLAVPTVAQTDTFVYNPTPGFYVNWVIDLHAATADGASGTAHYFIAKSELGHSPTAKGQKVVTKLLVECEYLNFPDLTPLDVFVGPGQSPTEPLGKLVGQMQVNGGSANLLTARPPVINKGNTVTITRNGAVIMTGKF
jgi:hypothetical protein